VNILLTTYFMEYIFNMSHVGCGTLPLDSCLDHFQDRFTRSIYMNHRWEDVKGRRFTAEKIAEIEKRATQDILEMDLRALRKAANLTQAKMAPLIAMTQSELSRMERRDDHRVSTLARYVRALGGNLKIVAEVGKKKVVLAEM
jgi:hypothetical protein